MGTHFPRGLRPLHGLVAPSLHLIAQQHRCLAPVNHHRSADRCATRPCRPLLHGLRSWKEATSASLPSAFGLVRPRMTCLSSPQPPSCTRCHRRASARIPLQCCAVFGAEQRQQSLAKVVRRDVRQQGGTPWGNRPLHPMQCGLFKGLLSVWLLPKGTAVEAEPRLPGSLDPSSLVSSWVGLAGLGLEAEMKTGNA